MIVFMIVERDACPYGQPVSVGKVKKWGKVDEIDISKLMIDISKLIAGCHEPKWEEF